MIAKPTTTVVWAILHLADESERMLRGFFIDSEGIKPRLVRKRLHITVYHARRPIAGLPDSEEAVSITVQPQAMRLMVMAPGGENPRPQFEPGQLNIGARLQRADAGCQAILQLRERFYPFETARVVGRRPPSTARTSAFGARHYQPHISLLRAGTRIDRDLAPLGERLRAAASPLQFDRLTITSRGEV